MCDFYRTGLSLLLVFSLTVMPALGYDGQKPLREKENPQLIGKRDINKGQLNFYSLEKEVAIGRRMAAEMNRYSKLLDDSVVLELVNRIAQNIVINSDIKIPVTVKVVDSSDINAFALPGGFLYVNRGLIEAADNEAELAGVIAHEAAHIAARHGAEQASKGNLINWASLPLIFLGGWGGQRKLAESKNERSRPTLKRRKPASEKHVSEWRQAVISASVE
jgi:predicted Zn-dependent protease